MEDKNKNLNKLFNPQSIAVVGASNKPGKVGTVIAENLLNLGYQGNVFLVNSTHTNLFGKKCYASLKDIEESIDLAVVAIPAKAVVDVIKNSSEKVKNFVVISAGFSEIGEVGKKREEELEKIAREQSLNILGPNCLGFLIPSLKLNASFAGGIPKPGNVVFISQSGALAVAVMDIFKQEKIGFSGVVSIGNKAQLDEADLIEFFGNSEETKVVALYLEGIKNGERLIRAFKEISAKKPIVILKAGRTEKSKKAVSSHTGALAGSDTVINAVLEKHHVIRADNMEKFLNIIKLVSLSKAPVNEKVAIITNAGGAGVLTTDAFQGKAIELAEISNEAKNELKIDLPEEAAVENPVDVLGDAQEDRYEKVLKILEEEKTGSILCILTPQQQTPVEKVTEKIISFVKETKKSVVTSFMGGEKVNSAIAKLHDESIANFSFPTNAISALDSYYRWSSLKSGKTMPGELKINKERKEGARRIINQAKQENKKALSYYEARMLLGLYDIKCSEFISLTSEKEITRKIRYPVVLKVDSDKVLHKTDKGGVIMDIKDNKELSEAIKKMRSNFPGGDLIAQPMLENQMELIVGMKKDEVFGPVVLVGIGGIYTEIFKKSVVLIPPMSETEIKDNLEKSDIKFLFRKTRGKEPYPVEKVAKAVSAAMNLANESEEIKELDINPLFIYNSDKDPVAVDIKVLI